MENSALGEGLYTVSSGELPKGTNTHNPIPSSEKLAARSYTVGMGEVLRNAAVFVCLSGVVAYGAFLVLDSTVNAEAKEEARTIVVRDVIDRNTHNLSGMAVVPSQCHELIAYTKQLDPSNYLLAFETWEDPSRTCAKNLVSRAFHLTLFAPSTGVAFQGTFNDRTIPLEVIETAKR